MFLFKLGRVPGTLPCFLPDDVSMGMDAGAVEATSPAREPALSPSRLYQITYGRPQAWNQHEGSVPVFPRAES